MECFPLVYGEWTKLDNTQPWPSYITPSAPENPGDPIATEVCVGEDGIVQPNGPCTQKWIYPQPEPQPEPGPNDPKYPGTGDELVPQNPSGANAANE